MKTPTHWKNKNILSLLLYPMGKLYLLASYLNIKTKTPKSVEKKVICIGNVTAGGSGKTPTSISIAHMLKKMGYNPFFVSRGYGGKLHGVLVNNKIHTPQEVGDEPLLLSYEAPIVVNPNRFEAAKKAIENGADIIIMDDGFQNQSLKKDISFLVFDGEFGCGNGFGIPAGPMRESLSEGLKRAQAIIILGEDKVGLSKQITNKPIFKGKVVPKIPDNTDKKVIAFAGIGRPEKFYNSLKECGFEIIETIDFPDHHQYQEKELLDLILKAKKSDAKLYTTSKDFVKIPQNLQKNFNTLEIEIKWENQKDIEGFLKQKIQ